MGVWVKQLQSHQDEGIERMGLDPLALPKLTLLQLAQLLGWWRARRGIRLDRKWWRPSMAAISRKARGSKGWAARVPTELNALAWAALEKVSLDLDRLAPAGKVSADNAFEPSGSQEIPGMLSELGHRKTPDPLKAAGFVPKIQAIAPKKIPLVPPIEVLPIDKVPKPPVVVPRLPSIGTPLLLLAILLLAAKSKRKK